MTHKTFLKLLTFSVVLATAQCWGMDSFGSDLTKKNPHQMSPAAIHSTVGASSTAASPLLSATLSKKLDLPPWVQSSAKGGLQLGGSSLLFYGSYLTIKLFRNTYHLSTSNIRACSFDCFDMGLGSWAILFAASGAYLGYRAVKNLQEAHSEYTKQISQK